MITVTASEAASLKDLGDYKEPVQICDAGGKVLGVFVPTDGQAPRKVRTGEQEAAYWAEVERRASDPKEGVPLREVYKRLLTLTDDESLKADLQQKIDILTERDRCRTT